MRIRTKVAANLSASGRTLAATDTLIWVIAMLFALGLRYDALYLVPPMAAVVAGALAIAVQWVLGTYFGLYSGRFHVGSFDEVERVVAIATASGFVAGLTNLLLPHERVSGRIPFGAIAIALVLMLASRLLIRAVGQLSLRPASTAEPALIVGAGAAGTHLVRDLQTTPLSPYRPVGFVDDDPAKARLTVSGVKVLGTTQDLPDLLRAQDVKRVIIAAPSASAQLFSRVRGAADETGATVKTLPSVDEILDGVNIGSLRDINMQDLLGRHHFDLDHTAIGQFLAHKTVLVTGAGGSIGSELCRVIHRFRPANLLKLDRDESALHGLELSLKGSGLLDTDDVILADLRDADTVMRIFQERKPDVVFHAAALKHLPMLEQYPSEAWQTNVLGTYNVLRAAEAVGVSAFVNISTDKAANPTSVLGWSKRVAERLTSSFAARTPGRFVSVRFGNVLGSRGSVLPTFIEQIQAGSNLTITHEDVTRYFMTIPEAAHLVLQATVVGRDGEALILDMGDPVRIKDMAQQLMALMGKSTGIEITGLRPGEKLHEELIGQGEADARPFHPLITHACVPGFVSPEQVVKGWAGTREEFAAVAERE